MFAMRKLNFCISLEDALIAELEHVALQRQLTPRQFVQEVVECALAARRLPFVRPSVMAARMTKAECPVNPRPMLAESRDVLAPMDIPTVTDMNCLEDIT
jgi:hypothetical protein